MVTPNTASSVISSDKVNGTNVYNPTGEKLGSIGSLVIDKISGQVQYAVMEFGGFLGIRTDNHPIPWNSLKYEPHRSGYVVVVTKEQLEDAPSYKRGTVWDYTDDNRRSVNDYYGAPYLRALSCTTAFKPAYAGFSYENIILYSLSLAASLFARTTIEIPKQHGQVGWLENSNFPLQQSSLRPKQHFAGSCDPSA